MKLPKITKLRSGNYRMQLQIGGVRTSITDTSIAKVKQRAKELIAQGEMNARDPTTVGEAIDKYIKFKSPKLSPSTITGYHKLRRTGLQCIMDRRLDKLTQMDVDNAVMADLEAGYNAKTIRNAHGLLSATLKRYRPHFILNTDLPEKDPTNINIPTEAQLMAIWKEAQKPEYDPQVYVCILLASWIGLRMSEILALRFENINNGYLYVSRAKVASENGAVIKEPKTKSGIRRIKISTELSDIILALPHDSDSEEIIRLYRSTINKKFVKICENINVPHFRIHDLRHFSASEALSLNVPNKYQMRRMGHKTENMLKNVYQHVMADKEDAFADIIDAHMLDLLAHVNAHEKI